MKIDILNVPFEVIAPTHTNEKGSTTTRSIHATTAQIWESFANGLTRAEIAKQFDISSSVVATHLGKCIKKVAPFIKKEDILQGLEKYGSQATQYEKNIYSIYKKLSERI